MWRAKEGQVGESPFSAPAIWAISLPLLLAEIGEVIIHVTDTALLARAGTIELGAIALADEVLEMWLALAVGLAQGVQIQIARRVGERRGAATLAAFRRGFVLAAFLGAALAAGLALAAPYVGRTLAGPGPLGVAVGSFLRAAAPGLLFEALNLTYSSLVVGTARTRILIAVTTQVAVTNFAFGYVLIFGRLGFPALGIAGAGWAYTVTEIVTFILLTAYTLRRYRHWWRASRRGTDRALRPLLHLSLPVSLEVLLDAARWLVFFLVVAQAGEDVLALSNVVYSVYNVLLLPGEAFGETVTTLVSNLFGRREGHRVRAFMRLIVPLCYLVTLPLAAAALLFPGTLLLAFGGEVAGIPGSEAALRLVALAMLVVSPAEMWSAALQGAAAADAALGLSILWTAVVLGWAYAATTVGLAPQYVWLGVPAGSAATLTLAYLWMRRGFWRNRRI